MAKITGLAWTAWQVDDTNGTLRDIRSPVQNLQISTPRAIQDITGLDKSAIERHHLLADLSGTMSGGAVDTGSNNIHDVASDLDNAREFLLTQGGKSLGVTGTPTILLTDYQTTRGQDGSFAFSVPFVLANGVVPTWST